MTVRYYYSKACFLALEKENRDLKKKLQEQYKVMARLEALEQENLELNTKLHRLCEAAEWGIEHVGAANYHSRQSEALRKVRDVYDS